ncbi:GDCCVxC domain-containing (seleno)protein [Mucilaginibacter sp. L196]|uniref:GDCCVxC domain-containing (seleno)protein n=1 Tax=Mucilaginibacter sp. L196 TaxID=1641870 RepID=UPI002739A03D|nr:GDCCVxC domain-containing (seleno)protein [Mucilaginibacter sp. L196]
MSGKIQLQSILICPNCGFKKEEMMATNACQYFYECKNYRTNLKRPIEDCCVFCNYGPVKHHSLQAGNLCCN